MRALSLLSLLLLTACHPRGHEGPTDGRASRKATAMYKVRWGDSLDWIAYRFDVPGGYQALARLNHVPDPDLIYMGDRLRIPRAGAITDTLPPWPAMDPIGEPLQACGAERLPPPQPATMPGCTAAACVSLDGWRRVCACDASTGTSGFIMLDGGRPVMAWPAPVTSSAGEDPYLAHGTPTDFDVVRADLDNDGRREHVVAFRREVNDLNMSWWNMAVISGASPLDPPLLFTSANYGEGSLIRNRSGSTCDLLSTTWEQSWEPSGPANTGWYLLGRPMRYHTGALAPIRGEPLRARRLYYSFEPGLQVLPGGLAAGTPVRDLNHRHAHERLVEPLAAGELLADEPVSITLATPRLEPALGMVSTLNLDKQGHAMTLDWEAYSMGYQGLGDAASERLYPPGYRPAAAGWPTGNQASLASYAMLWGEPRRLLWVQR